jgi:hypothetical protein
MRNLIGSKILLTKEEQKICEYIGKRRYKINREKGVTDKKIGEEDNLFMDQNGFGGEFAFCKLFNVMPDFLVQVTQTNKNDYDALLFNCIKVDVKTTDVLSGRLLAAPWKVDEVDCYALIVGTIPNYIFKGFMLRDDLKTKDRYKSLKEGYSKGYVAEQNELKELHDLFYLDKIVNTYPENSKIPVFEI